MREKLMVILDDELNTRTSSTSQRWIRNSNKDIMCAVRLLDVIKISDFDLTVKLAECIRDSWTDLEPTEKQKDAILNELVRLLKTHNEKIDW